MVIVYRPGASGSTLGVALVLAAVLACAVYTVLSRLVVTDGDSLSVIIVQQVAALTFAVAALALAEAIFDGQVSLDDFDLGTGVAIVASGALYYGMAFWLYLAGLRRTSATYAGSFLTLIPVFGLLAAATAGESLTGQQWMGAALVIGGVAVILLSPAHALSGSR